MSDVEVEVEETDGIGYWGRTNSSDQAANVQLQKTANMGGTSWAVSGHCKHAMLAIQGSVETAQYSERQVLSSFGERRRWPFRGTNRPSLLPFGDVSLSYQSVSLVGPFAVMYSQEQLF